MFLITETEDELLPAALRGESPSRKPNYQGPEPDALVEMDKIFSQFAPGSLESFSYTVADSQLDEHLGCTTLRAIGGATYRSIKDEGKPLLDGLAANLLRRILNNGGYSELAVKNLHSLIFDSASKKFTSLPVDELIRYLNDPEYWKPLPLKGRTKEFEFSISTVSKRRERMVFIASFDDGDPWPTDSPLELMCVRIGGKFGGPDLFGQILEREIANVLEDQQRRRKLAERFQNAPRVRGIKGSIRETIARDLQKAGVRRGSYSREGFSSGRFPYPTTRSAIDGRKWDLLFRRCEHCGAVKELTVEPHDERTRYTDARSGLNRIEDACARLTTWEIGPWHESFCPGESAKSLSTPAYAPEDL